jgi:hypothetical protein
VLKLVFSDGLRAKDFYDLFIFKPNTIISNVLADVYLQSVLLEEFDLLAKIKDDKWYFITFSKNVGWLKGQKYKTGKMDEIHVTVNNLRLHVHSVLGKECFSNNSPYHGVIYYIDDFFIFGHLVECIFVLHKER